MSLPNVIRIPLEDEKSSVPDIAKRIVICTTKDISKEDLDTLSSYGKVLEFDSKLHLNLDLQNHLDNWCYIVFNMSVSEDRYSYLKQIVPNADLYDIIEYSYSFEKDQIIREACNKISSLPKKQPSKKLFDFLLTSERIQKPQTFLSLLSCLLNVYQKVK